MRDEEQLRTAAANGDEGAQRELNQAYAEGQLSEPGNDDPFFDLVACAEEGY